MKSTTILVAALSVTGASASWFGSDTPSYTDWSTTDLKKWLGERNINAPESFSQEQLRDLVKSNWDSATAWTQDQYAAAQKSFADLREASFDAWDESRLREFLLAQGVVAPSGPREQLVLLAKNKYAAYTSAASRFSAQASTAVYGDSMHQATKSAASYAAQATREAARQMDDAKDYVYSTWEDSQLRDYLVEKGAQAKDVADKKRAELLVLMRDAYARVTTPVWEAWSESYMREWLIAHDVLTVPPPSKAEVVKAKMAQYYYDTNDSVWSTWSDSDIKAWLVSHGIVKSDAQAQRDKLVKLLQENYVNAQDTLWGAWSDSQMRDWLVEHGEKTVPAKRDELVKLMQSKYDDAAGMSAAYLTWPDARLRAYLRNHGMDESALPTSRPGLLQETRIRWVQAMTTLDHIREIVYSSVGAAEDKLSRVLEMLRGEGAKTGAAVKDDAKKMKEDVKKGKENVKTKASGEL